MGLITGGNSLYLNVSCGFLKNKAKDISARGYDNLILNKAEQAEDEYQGSPIQKVKLHCTDYKSGENVVITFTMESWYAVGFFSRIRNIDLEKPFTIGASASEQNEKISFCWLKQAGKEKIESDKTFPAPAKVKLGSKEVLDWTKTDEEMLRVIEWINSIEHTPVTAPEQPNKGEPEKTPLPEDDLPF